MTFQDDTTVWMWNSLGYLLPVVVFLIALVAGAAWFMKKGRPVIGTILLLIAAPIFFYAFFQAPIKVTTDVSYDTVPPAHARGDEKTGPAGEKNGSLENSGSEEKPGAPQEAPSSPTD